MKYIKASEVDECRCKRSIVISKHVNTGATYCSCFSLHCRRQQIARSLAKHAKSAAFRGFSIHKAKDDDERTSMGCLMHAKCAPRTHFSVLVSPSSAHAPAPAPAASSPLSRCQFYYDRAQLRASEIQCTKCLRY